MRRGLILVAASAAIALAAAAPAAPPAPGATTPESQPASHGSSFRNPQAPTRYLYVPYPDLEAVLEPGTKGVLLSRAEYDRLWAEAAAARARLALAGKAPVQAAILSADYTGQVTGDRAVVKAAFTLEVLDESGAVAALPLDLRGVAIDSATLDGRPALVGGDRAGRLTLFIADAAPGRHALAMALSARVIARDHDSILRLGLPPTPAATVTLTFDGDLDVSASAPIVERTYDQAANKTTVRLVPQGRSPQQSAVSNQRSEEGDPQGPDLIVTFVSNDVRREREPLIVSDVTALATVSEGSVSLEATCNLTVLLKPLDRFAITLPADLAVTEVSEANLLGWTVERDTGDRQKLTVQLNEPRSAAAIRLAASGRPASLAGWTFPQIATEGAAIERGVLALALPPEVRAQDERLLNVRRADGAAGQPVSATPIVREYAFWRQPYRCEVDIVPVVTETAAFNNIVLRLAQEELQLTTQVTFVPREGRLYQARVCLPATWDVIAVGTSRAANEYTWQEVKSPDGASKDVVVNLKHRVAPREPFVVTIDARQAPADWPDRSWTERTVPVPDVRVPDAVEVRGQLGVWADPEFRITPLALTDLVPVDVRELKELNGGHLALGFRFDRQPAGRFNVVRREPRVQVETVGCASLSERVLRSTFQLNYTVEHAGQDTFRFVVEGAPTGGKIVVRGVQPPAVGGVRPSAVAVKHWDRLADFAGPGEAWVVQTQRRQRGPVSLLVTFERELAEEPAGATQPTASPARVAVPTVRCLDVEGQSGYLLVAGRDDTELTAEPTGLMEVDPSDVPALSDYGQGKVVKAYRYLGLPIGLVLSPTRHPPAAVPEALVTRADLTTVVERDGACRTRAVFHLAMAQPSPVRVKLPAGAALWTAQVNGQPIKPNLIDGGLAIPVETISAGGIQVSILYVHEVSLPAAGRLALDPPVVVGLEVGETAWSVYLPEDLQYLAPAGTMEVVRRPIEPLAVEQTLRAIGQWWEALRSLGRARAYAINFGRVFPSRHRSVYEGKEAPHFAADYMEPEAEQAADEEGPAAMPQAPEEAPAPRRPDGSTLTLEVPLTTRGQVYRFHRLDGSGRAGIAYAPKRAYRFLAYAAFGVAVVLGSALGWARFRRRVQYVLVVLIAASVAPSLVGEGFTAVANGAFWGGLVTAGWYLVHWLGRLGVRVIAWASGNPTIHVGRPSPRTAAMIVFVIAALAAGTVSAAGTAGQDRPSHTASAAVDEHTVIVPYDPAHPERARESDRVYLPYERYVEMWNLAYPDQLLAWPGAPPVDAILRSAAYFGRLAVEGDDEKAKRVAFQAEFGIHVFREGWTEVPVNLGGVAVREATLDDQPTTLAEADGVYRLYVNAAGAHTLRVWFVAKASVLGETGRCAFTVPPLAAAFLELAVPSEDVEVAVSNAAGGQTETRGTARTVVQAQLGPVGRVEFTWRPRARRVERETAISATAASLVSLTESAVRLTAVVRYVLAQGTESDGAGARQRFALAIPADLEIERVLGDNIRAWRVTDSEEVADPALKGRKALQLVLHRPTTTGLEVTVHGYRKRADRGAAEVVGAYDLPVVHTLEAGRETGHVGLEVDPALALVVVQTAGLQEINASEFDVEGLGKGTSVRSAYRYARRPASIRAAVTRRVPEVTAAVFTALRIRREETTLRSVIDLDVKDLSAHHLRIALPAEVANVGVAAGDAQGDLLENWHTAKEAGRSVLTVNLSRGALGSARVTLTGDLPKPAPDATLALPQVALLAAARQSGHVAVSAAAGMEVSPATLEGLTAVDAATLADRVALEADERLVLGFRYDAPGYSADLALRFLSPRVTAETVSHVLIADTFVAYRFAVGYVVENAGVRAFRFSLPASMGESVEVTGEHIRQTTSAVEGEGASARRVWTVTLQGEVMGAFRLFVYHEAPAPDGGRISLPRIDILDVARSRNYVAVQNTSRLEVRPKQVAVAEPIAPAELPILPQGTRSADVLGAWRCINGLWAIDLDLVAHEGQEVQRDTVELMDVITVVDRGGYARSRITYRLANRTQQFLELAMPEGWRLWGAQVAQKPVRPATAVRQGRPLVLIPLIKTAPSDLNYDAVVVCEGPIGGSLKSSISTVTPEVVSMQVVRTVLTLYLPPGYHYLNDRGNLERTVASERAYQQTVTLLAEQDRLQRLAKHAVGPVSWEAWSNYRRNRDVLASQMEVTYSANAAAMEETSGLLANPKERARAQELQKKMAEASQQLSQLSSNEADLADQIAPQATIVDGSVSMLEGVRSNTWDFNDAVDPISRRLWKGEEGDKGGDAREGQVGRRYGRWMGKTQQDGGWTDRPVQPQAQPGAQRGVGGQVVRLGNVSPREAEAALKQLFADQTRGGELGAGLNKKASDVTIQADTDNNTLIIQGDPETVQVAERLLKELDTASAGTATSEVRVIALKNADASQVARTVNGLFQTRTAARRGDADGDGRAVASFDPRTNSLVVSASKDDQKQIEELVARLDEVERAPGPVAGHIILPPSPPTAGEALTTPADDFGIAAVVLRDDQRGRGGAAPAEGEGGLLSVAFDIPKVGTRLDFVKTQGDPRLTISVVDAGLVRKVAGLGVGLALLFVALAVTDWRRTVRFLRALRVLVPLALVAVGGWSIVTGMHRPIGIGVAAAGALLLAWAVAAMRRHSRRAASAA